MKSAEQYEFHNGSWFKNKKGLISLENIKRYGKSQENIECKKYFYRIFSEMVALLGSKGREEETINFLYCRCAN